MAGPFRGEVFEGTETKVRLDDDIQRGAFGLTADKTSKATGSDNRASGTSKRGTRGADPHVANALRNAYQQAVSEDVPQEFLDLLGKLS
jgi:Anti-sigma factor NepR